MNQDSQPKKPVRLRKRIWLWAIVICVAVIAPFAIFMLTSTFAQKEPDAIHVPTAVTEEKESAFSLVTILVASEADGKAKVCLSLDLPDKMKKEILNQAVAIYNGQEFHNEGFPISISGEGVEKFLALKVIDASFGNLAAMLGGLDCPHGGIPIDANKDIEATLSDFQIWCRAIVGVAEEMHGTDSELCGRMVNDGSAIVIKADKDTPFDAVSLVFDNLQEVGLDKFTLMTSLTPGPQN